MGDDVRPYQLWWDEDLQMVRTVWAPGAVCGIEEARALADAAMAMGRGPVLVLSDISGLTKIERSAREYLNSNEIVRALAMVTDSPLTKILASFLMNVRRDSLDVAMFTSEDEAIKWLRARPL